MTHRGLEFWRPKWQTGQIGFHEGAPNELLVRHAHLLGAQTRVLVPLAGKAVDLVWLAEQGHDVVGIEVVPEAVHEFFSERKLTPKNERCGRHEVFRAGGVSLVLADVFDVTPEALGTFDAIYDRAALVALEPAQRQRYVEICARMFSPIASACTLLVCFAYEQTRAPGPPFSVEEFELGPLFSPRTIRHLETRRAPVSPRLAAAGIPHFDESIYAIA